MPRISPPTRGRGRGDHSSEPSGSRRPAAQRRGMARHAPVRGPQRAPTKVPVSIRLDADLVERLKAEGAGRQSRANDMLRRAAGLD